MQRTDLHLHPVQARVLGDAELAAARPSGDLVAPLRKLARGEELEALAAEFGVDQVPGDEAGFERAVEVGSRPQPPPLADPEGKGVRAALVLWSGAETPVVEGFSQGVVLDAEAADGPARVGKHEVLVHPHITPSVPVVGLVPDRGTLPVFGAQDTAEAQADFVGVG